MKLTKLFGVAALATVATFALAACGSSKSSKSSDKDGVTTVKVGVMSLSDTEEARWKEVQKNLDDAKANIKLEFTEFTDYSQPNQLFVMGMWISMLSNITTILKTGTKKRKSPKTKKQKL